jgi:hypothetical protein
MARRSISKEVREARARAQKHGKRQEGIRSQRLLIILACEGEKTERFYFESWFEILKASGGISNHSCVIAPHSHTNPTGVLKDLKSFRSLLGWSYADYEHRWIIIDRDEERTDGGGHTLADLNQALISSQSSKPLVNVAWSNPCFEIWYLLHFHFHITPIVRDRVQEKLTEVLQHEYQKNDSSMLAQLTGKPLDDAIRNASRLEEERVRQGLSPADANPGTKVYQLVLAIKGILQA